MQSSVMQSGAVQSGAVQSGAVQSGAAVAGRTLDRGGADGAETGVRRVGRLARGAARVLIAALLAVLAVAGGLPATAMAGTGPASAVVPTPPPLPSPPVTPPPPAPPPPPPCQVERNAHGAIGQQIAAHNAREHTVPNRVAAAVAAYNAEADQLNAANQVAVTNLQTCLQAAMMRALERAQAQAALRASDPGGPVVRPIPADTRFLLEQARNSVPRSWTAPPKPPGRPWRVEPDLPVRQVYEILRKRNPGATGDVLLRGQPRPRVGDVDPAYPNARIAKDGRGQPSVSPDHIIPLAELVQMPGFTRLSPEDMYLVANSPINLQWLSRKANLAKGSRSAADMLGVDPKWQAAQVELENEIRAKLQELINRLLADQS